MFTVQSSVGSSASGERGGVRGVALATSGKCRHHAQKRVMTSEQTSAEMGRTRIVRELHELIAALDRRVPRVERVGEIAIARAAEALRDEALKRIATLERESDADAIAS
jgi:hypothetical protein